VLENVTMDLGLRGKVALVTSANRGIGAAIAMQLAREGVDLCLVARDLGKLNEVATAMRGTADIRAAVHSADLREPSAAAAAIKVAIDMFGRLDILVNNAGATKRADFFALTDEDFLDGFALKFHRYVRMTRVGRPDEIGAMTAFLASGKAHYLQAPIIDVDGGATRSL
jgi:NAD(P)-dependent dehydrogenase (short-subunit alcohol dehydrogenase family)